MAAGTASPGGEPSPWPEGEPGRAGRGGGCCRFLRSAAPRRGCPSAGLSLGERWERGSAALRGRRWAGAPHLAPAGDGCLGKGHSSPAPVVSGVSFMSELGHLGEEGVLGDSLPSEVGTMLGPSEMNLHPSTLRRAPWRGPSGR